MNDGNPIDTTFGSTDLSLGWTEAGHFHIRNLLNEVRMRGLSKPVAPLKAYIRRTWNLNGFILASQ